LKLIPGGLLGPRVDTKPRTDIHSNIHQEYNVSYMLFHIKPSLTLTKKAEVVATTNSRQSYVKSKVAKGVEKS
jgi:hypothetical protein